MNTGECYLRTMPASPNNWSSHLLRCSRITPTMREPATNMSTVSVTRAQMQTKSRARSA